jgi:hypothetical protein
MHFSTRAASGLGNRGACLGGWYFTGDNGRVIHIADRHLIRLDAFNGNRVVP